MSTIKRGIYIFGALWLACLVPRHLLAQQFRVQINSLPHVPEAQERATGKARPHPTVVSVDLRAYVEGVLAGEASVLKNRAALQAMAILARTWALGHRGRHRAQGFDFCSLTHCQVFLQPVGPQAVYPPTIVDAGLTTRDLVLMYRGRLADPYFTADCGGVTESAANLWPDRNLPYLVCVHDPYCAASEHSSWQREIPLGRLAPILREGMGVTVRGAVRDVRVASRDSAGRVRTLEVLADNNLQIDANRFRYAVGRRLGWGILESNLYTVHRRGETLVFNGRGLGHGVGFCQAGAESMAGLGIGYQGILAHYFPGTTVGEFAPRKKPSADPVAASEHFEFFYPESQQPWVSRGLNVLEGWRKVLARQVSPSAARVRVTTWDTTAEFINATGEPGWAAGSSDGKEIFLQPLDKLARKGILDSTLRHELTHLTLHRLCASGVPEWFEEGLALYLTGEPTKGVARPRLAGRTLGESMARPRSAVEMQAAYGRAAALVRQLAQRRGPQVLWQMLERPTPSDWKWLREMEAKPLAP